MTWKKNPASMGGGGDFPREFGMWFGGAGRAGHPATSRGAAILKKSLKEKELVGKERKKVIAKLAKKKRAAKKKESEKPKKRGRVKGKSYPLSKETKQRLKEQKLQKELQERKDQADKDIARSKRTTVMKRELYEAIKKSVKVQKIPEGKSSSQAEVTGKKITTKEEAKRIRDYIKTQKMLDDYTN